MSVFTLYRFYDAAGALLYVGLSVNPGRRLEKHKAIQPWWPDVARIEMEQHPDMPTLRAAEREAIETEAPLYNNRMSLRPFDSYLTWTCDECGKPIQDEEGYITVSYADIGRYRRGVAEWSAAHPDSPSGLTLRPLSDWSSYPEPAKWRVLHRCCDPNIDSNDYWYSIERCRTYPDLLERTAHLIHKTWFQSTTWDTILRRAA